MGTSEAKTRPIFINPWRRYVGAFIPNWLLRRTEISPQSKLLYARLAQYAGQKGIAFPRQDTLTAELGCSDPRSIRRYVKELRDHGLIHVEDRRNKNFPNKYKFLDHPWQYEDDVIDDDVEVTPEGQGGHRTETSSGSGGPQDKSVLSGQDRSVLSRRESRRRESPPEENHTAGADRSGHGYVPTAKPKAFSATPSLGSEQENDLAEERRPISAARPKTRNVDARKARAEKKAAEAIKRSKSQVAKNAERAMERQERKDQNLANLNSKGPQKPSVKRVERLWADLMERHLEGLTIAKWAAKERGQAKELLEKYGGQIVDEALRYVVENWEHINERIFRGRADHPTIGMVLKLHDTLVIEAQKWSKHKNTISEWGRWATENPDSYDPPGDLDERYETARKELKALGIGGA